ncbi:hypothetical protein BDF19DRAFT_462890 [Syncephalis fuscata]|nr:hypothetical protein BDF19DRAFT_462890 [Syncephalis fuscata]
MQLRFETFTFCCLHTMLIGIQYVLALDKTIETQSSIVSDIKSATTSSFPKAIIKRPHWNEPVGDINTALVNYDGTDGFLKCKTDYRDFAAENAVFNAIRDSKALLDKNMLYKGKRIFEKYAHVRTLFDQVTRGVVFLNFAKVSVNNLTPDSIIVDDSNPNNLKFTIANLDHATVFKSRKTGGIPGRPLEFRANTINEQFMPPEYFIRENYEMQKETHGLSLCLFTITTITVCQICLMKMVTRRHLPPLRKQ